MSNWQPIETAPKDGTRILLTDGDDCGVAGWDDDRKEWIVACVAYMDHNEYVDFYAPTHWMPLAFPH